MKYSKGGLHLTEQFEGCRLVAYHDSVGIPTIAWGHTSGVHMGMTCTQEQAEAWLAHDVEDAEEAVNRLVRVPLNQNQFDALVDLAYNVGSGNFANSTLLKMLNINAFDRAAHEFERWNKAGGIVRDGLTKRRFAEEGLFQMRVT
jgi:lysozyme